MTALAVILIYAAYHVRNVLLLLYISALLAIGVATALLRRASIFQALGFLVAENGVYAAALGTPDGLPALIEVGLIFDLVVVISVAALFSARIHEQLGTADTGLLREIRE